MRISELSRSTGVPVPTIKYYVREGLLPPGELTSRNQANYDETHERRLRLIRALLDVGGLKVAAIAEVLGAVDDPARPVHKVLGAAADHLGTAQSGDDDAESAAAGAAVAELIARRGWRAHGSDPAAGDLARALAAMDRVGHGGSGNCSTTTRTPPSWSPAPTWTMWIDGWRSTTGWKAWWSARSSARRCSTRCAASRTWTRRRGCSGRTGPPTPSGRYRPPPQTRRKPCAVRRAP